jgi:hypothetical protein
LNGGKPTPPPTTPTTSTTIDPTASTTTTSASTTTTPTEGGHPICGHTSGIKPDPSDCHAYFMCQDLGMGQWEVKHFDCGPGLAYNPEIQTCDWTENVPGCEDKRVKTKKSFNPLKSIKIAILRLIQLMLMISLFHFSRNQRLQFSPEKYCLNVQMLDSSLTVRHPIVNNCIWLSIYFQVKY